MSSNLVRTPNRRYRLTAHYGKNPGAHANACLSQPTSCPTPGSAKPRCRTARFTPQQATDTPATTVSSNPFRHPNRRYCPGAHLRKTPQDRQSQPTRHKVPATQPHPNRLFQITSQKRPAGRPGSPHSKQLTPSPPARSSNVFRHPTQQYRHRDHFGKAPAQPISRLLPADPQATASLLLLLALLDLQ